MTFQSLLLILRKQISQKWARFLLASGGIMIGIWAITLTSSLSFGLSDTLIKAVNSQPFAKEFTLLKFADQKNNIFELSGASNPIAMNTDELKSIKDKYPSIVDISPALRMQILVPKKTEVTSCLNNNTENLGNNGNNKDCANFTLESATFNQYFETNKSKWAGKTDKPDKGEIVSCFKCGDIEFNKVLGVSDPEDMIGKELTFEFNEAPETYQAGKEIIDDTNNSDYTNQDFRIKKSVKKTVKVVAVVDDRESNGSFGSVTLQPYLDTSYFIEAAKIQRDTENESEIGFPVASVYLDSYQNLNSTLDGLKNDKYFTVSLAKTLIDGIQAVFSVLTVVLSGFGFIALVASVFGIVNVMTISVLERRKEIGVLKSLGAKDMDIFKIFFLESAVLGFIGWLGGTLLALFGGFLISTTFKAFINSNSDWKRNLEGLNIDNFAPSFPWWLLLGTLAIALFFTTLSGIFPAIRAGRQNPVDVLRSE